MSGVLDLRLLGEQVPERPHGAAVRSSATSLNSLQLITMVLLDLFQVAAMRLVCLGERVAVLAEEGPDELRFSHGSRCSSLVELRLMFAEQVADHLGVSSSLLLV